MHTKFITSLFVVAGMAAAQAQTISVYPYIQDFENQFLCSTNNGSPCPMNIDWQNDTTDNLDWTATNQPTPTGSTGPDYDHTTGGGMFMYLESSGNGIGNPFKEARMLSPYFNFTTVASPRLRFWYHVYGFTMGDLYVDARQGSNGVWSPVVGPLTGDIDLWQMSETILHAWAGLDSVQFRFRGITGNSFSSDMAVDDVEVIAGIANDVMTIGAGGLPVSGCQLSSYTVYVDIVNNGANTLGAGTVIPVHFSNGTQNTSENLVLAAPLATGDTVQYVFSTQMDFSAQGSYDVHFWTAFAADTVYTNNDSLHWGIIEHSPFITQFPYYQDFEQGSGGWAAFNNNDGAMNGTWALGYPSKRTIIGAASGQNAWTTGGLGTLPYNDNDLSWVQSPCFDISALCNPQVELSVWWESELEWDGAALQVSTNGGGSWQHLGAFGDPHQWFNTDTIDALPNNQPSGWSGGGANTNGGAEQWLQARHNLSAYAGATSLQFRILFASDNIYNDDGFAFDDFHVYDGLNLTAGLPSDTLIICGADAATLDAKGDAGDAYLWSNGATSSTISVTTAGTYSVTVTSGLCVASDTLVVAQRNYPVVPLGGDTVYTCVQYTLDAGSDGVDYQWSNGQTQASFVTFFNGWYYVTVTNASGCATQDSLFIELSPLVVLDLGTDTAICRNIVMVADTGFSNYYWSTGDSTQALNIEQSGVYSVIGLSPDGCYSYDTIEVTVLLPNAWGLGADTSGCDAVVLSTGLGGGYGYLWSTGSTAANLTADASGDYWVEISAGACSERDTVNVSIFDSPQPYLGADTTICQGDTALLDAGIGQSYVWSNGANSQSQSVFAAGTYGVTVVDANGCTGSDQIEVSVMVCGGTTTLQTNDNALLLYPNPAQTQFYLLPNFDDKQVQLSIYNAAGQVLQSLFFDEIKAENSINIELSSLFVSGAYWLHWQGAQVNAVQSFVVKLAE